MAFPLTAYPLGARWACSEKRRTDHLPFPRYREQSGLIAAIIVRPKRIRKEVAPSHATHLLKRLITNWRRFLYFKLVREFIPLSGGNRDEP